MSAKKTLANPSRLKSFDSDNGLLRVIIETPKGSRNKYDFDSKERVFHLKTVLPAGMAFPYDFGFVPSTLAEDGDPVDVLVLMDEPAFPGCVLECRVAGVIEGEQIANGQKLRNDRIIAVEQAAHNWRHVKTIADLGNRFIEELEQFFVNYHRMSNTRYRVLRVKGPKTAKKLVKAGKL